MKFFDKLGKFFTSIGCMILDLLTDRVKENGNVRKISLGRVCFLILFVASVSIWLSGTDIAANMLVVLSTLLAYVFGSKVTEAITALKGGNTTPIVIVNPEEAGD